MAFSLFWGLVKFAIQFLVGNSNGKTFTYALKVIHYYLLAALTARGAIHFLASMETPRPTLLASVGAIVLCVYLRERLEKSSANFQLNAQLQTLTGEAKIPHKNLILIGTVVLFVLNILFPIVVDYSLINGIFYIINSWYTAPILGTLISIVGFIFTVNIVVRFIRLSRSLFGGETTSSTNRENSHQKDYSSKNDDEFVDFEIIEDDK